MGAYGEMDKAIAGLKHGLDSRVESRAAAEVIAFGMPVFGYRDDEKNAYLYKSDRAKIVFDADFVASNSIVLTINGVALGAVTFTTNHDNTMNLLVSAVEAAGHIAYLDAADVNNRTLLIVTKGVAATVAEAVTGGSSQPDGTITYDSYQIFLGVALFTQKYVAGDGDGEYLVGDAVNVLAEGQIWAEGGAAVVSGDAATVAVADGKFGASGYDTGAVYRSSLSVAGLVLVEVRGQNADNAPLPA